MYFAAYTWNRKLPGRFTPIPTDLVTYIIKHLFDIFESVEDEINLDNRIEKFEISGLKLTVHFHGRMPERNIDIDHVKQAIEHPDEKKPDPQGIKVKKKVGAKTIVVVYSEEKFRDKHGHFLIITAYYL